MTPGPALLCLLLGLAAAQEDVAGTAADTSRSELARAFMESLQRDPSVADSLAGRINDSRIAAQISGSSDPRQRQAEIRKWVQDNPDSAAHLAVGLAADDQEGSHRFEEMVLRNTSRSFHIDAGKVRDSTYGRLKKSSLDSKLMRADGEMSEEEKREILKTMFEGQGGMSDQIVNQAAGAKAAGGPGTAGLAAGYYDRLSGLNLKGYSPQLMAMQSSLNQRRAPGAPRLLETGKLDYETLSYPAYGMRWDLRNLENRLRYQKNADLARLSGLAGRYKPEQLLDPAVEAALLKNAGDAKLDARFAKRALALERAAAALRGFEAAALRARSPDGITRGLMLELGAKQKEAARWITAASLEEELQRLDEERGFLSDELKGLIAACPAPEGTRSAYLRRGEGYEGALLKMRSNAEDALRRLESEAWQSSIAAIEAALAENAALRKDLGRNIRDYVNTPYQLASLSRPQPRWKELLAGTAERWLPGTSWGRRLRGEARQRGLLKDVFVKIATGDLDAAHAILASSEPAASGK
ncbi:MAG: hypothetical protein HY926_15925 [Elusimicrobia bacterium]|nr:hypothetical protein [Elusimicrobiota bacterium]